MEVKIYTNEKTNTYYTKKVKVVEELPEINITDLMGYIKELSKNEPSWVDDTVFRVSKTMIDPENSDDKFYYDYYIVEELRATDLYEELQATDWEDIDLDDFIEENYIAIKIQEVL